MRAVTGVKLFPTPGCRLRLLLGLLVLFGSCCFRCEAQRLAQQEVTVLRQIASKLRINWDFTVDPCSGTAGWAAPQSLSTSSIFSNLTCDCTATATATNTNVCHVTSILLKGQNLTGVLADEFAKLTSLRVIDLSRNYLSGPIPVAWASLPLTNLSLQANRISGIIPKELGSITTLQSLTLEANLLQGQIPAALGNLVNLERFLASSNYFTGELPESLGKLKNMTDFRINGNAISGKIPSFIGNWTKLQKLHMLGTSLEGPFPQNFVTLESINELVVSDLKGGDGKFPPLQNMSLMQELVLRNLSISGEIPNFFGGMTNLKKLDLSFNNLTGAIPSSIDGLEKSLNYMFLTNNMLSGVIPNWILSSAWNLDLSYNNFTGLPAPDQCQQGNVNLVSSYSSTTSNSILTCLRKNNPCPQEAKNYNLFINCGGNKVNIDGNEYEGDPSPQGASIYAVSDSGKWAYSSTGYYQGIVNAHYVTSNAALWNMTNQALYMTARLSPISLRYYGLCLQTGNYSVKLHFAEIMFTDDETFSSVGRRLFDVYIQGQKVLPDFDIAKEANGTGKEITRNFTATVDGTLEIQFQWVGKGTSSVPQRGVYGPLISAISVTPNFDPKIDGNKLSLGAILGIIAASCVVIVSIMIIYWFFCRRKDDENSELRGLELQTGYFSLKQIKAATNNFDPANKIGEGGFGPVYMGVMPDGSTIAVKQLSSKSKQGNREFLNEIGMISALHHPNLVKLFGCCVEGSQLLLIYEYMENNSLARALFGPERNRLRLDWQTRRKICLGIARGLSYLHEESRLKIVHRDIKATNVLLDKDLNAKISDFGLARLDEEEHSHISTRIAGTIGYMAPEYAMRGYLTDKADVYSFGVVTLEIVSGMSNTNYRPKEDCVYLLDSAYVLQEQGSLLELVDPNLGSNYSKDEALQMLNLALICTKPSPTLRPPMSAVVSMLDGRTPLRIPSVKPGVSRSEEMRFKAFERLSHGSRTQSTSTDGLSHDGQTQSISTDRLSHDGRTQSISTDRLSHDSRTQSISADGPWVDSSMSVPSSKASTSYSAEVKLLPELTE